VSARADDLALLGTRLRHLVEVLDAGVSEVEAELGLSGFRPRFAPFVQVLRDLGPSPIRDLARAVAVTHSAASQTVSQMAAGGLVVLTPGGDARQRIVELTPHAESMLPALDVAWSATRAAAAELDAELPFPLTEVVAAAERALEHRSFRERITGRLAVNRT
jgi:DNA-binding MarR family transcriptional regulator